MSSLAALRAFLIERLTPLLRSGAPSRVINVTSGGQYDQKIPEARSAP